MSYDVQIRRAAELDVAEAQLWYEAQRSGLGAEFHSEVSRVIDRLAETPLICQVAYRDIRKGNCTSVSSSRLVSSLDEVVVVLACTHGRKDPSKPLARLQ